MKLSPCIVASRGVGAALLALCLVQPAPRLGYAQAPTAPLAATATIDTRRTHQTLIGFGAATAYYQNWIAGHPNKKALYQAFFGDLNLHILRLQNSWRPGKGADFAANDADIVRGAKAATGHAIPVLMCSWSPPAALKSTGDEKHGGTLAQKDGAFVYPAFADYWADSLAAYNRAGVAPTWASIQNEPDWQADWETCRFQPHEETDSKGIAYAGYDKALDAVALRFKTLPRAPQLLGPETLGIGGGKVTAYLAPASPQAREVGGVAYHLYYGGDHQKPDTFIPALHSVRDAFPNKPIWMTEFGRSDGFQTAWCIHNTLVEGNAAAYVYWAGMWPGVDTLITLDDPAKPAASWKTPAGFAPTDRYFGLKHFSRFVTPGYKRVEVATSDPALKVSAYLSPNGSRLVVVALNTSEVPDATRTLSLRIAGFVSQGSAVYRSVLPAPLVTPTTGEKVGVCGPGERFRSLGPLPAARTATLPPRSIVTVVLDRRAG